MATTQRKTERATIETRILRNEEGMATGVEFDVIGCAPFTIHTSDLSSILLAEAACHGLKQKIGDAAAIARNPETGRAATPGDKRLAMLTIRNRLTEEQAWNAPRTEGGSMSLTLAALVRLYPGKTRADLEAWLGSKSVKAQAALRTEPVVADMIATIKAERAASKPGVAGVDVAGLLSELNDAEGDEDGEEDEPADE